jgi:starch-binding outer membrane protein, SusD/RagB family
MKKIYNIILLSSLIFGATSCSDFLDQESPSEMTTDVVFNSPYYSGLVLNKVYGALTQDATYSQYLAFVWPLNSDCELVDGLGQTNSTNTSSERGNMNYNANPGWANLAKGWDALYGAIEYANLVIDGVNGSTNADSLTSNGKAMLRYKGEALTLRAMMYFDLIRYFGDVPYKAESTKTDLSNVYLPKTDRDTIMDHIIADLEEAIPLLPWAGENSYTTEHATKGYAHALLANIALTRAGWAIREKAKEGYETATENSDPTYPTQRPATTDRLKYYKLALTHLNAVISSGVHGMNSNIENEWYQINQRTLDTKYRENIFEIPMGLNKSGELGYTVGVRINGASIKYGPKGNSSGKLKLTAPFFWSFDHKDLRRDITCAPYTLSETNGILTQSFDGNAPFAIYCGKWDIRKMNEEWRAAALASTNKVMTGINTIKMRYPQVLLMYAEVMNEINGNPDVNTGGAGMTAREALSAVHCRAFADSDKAAAKTSIDTISTANFFNAIVNENAWELAGEGFRKYDLIRWNLLNSKIDQMKSDYTKEINQYPEKLYYKTIDSGDEVSIDMSSVCWYAAPENTDGYSSKTFWGAEATASTQTNLTTYLPYISAGLNSTVKNRYLLPIGSTTISASQGKLHNSYGYSD